MRLIRSAALAAALAFAGAASAQTRDFNLERLRLDPSAQGALVLGGGEVLPEGALRLSLTYHYEQDPVAVADDATLRGVGLGAKHDAFNVVSRRVTQHLGLAYGLKSGFEFVAEVPVVLDQAGDAAGLDAFAFAAPRIGLRLGTAGASPVAAAVGLEVEPQWSTKDAFEGDPGWQFLPSVGASWRLGGSMLIANLSGVLRTQAIALTGSDRLHHELHAGLGWTTLDPTLRFEVTARGALGETGQGAEVLGGVRYHFLRSTEVYAIAGPGFMDLVGTPTFRALVGLAWGTTAFPKTLVQPVAKAAPPPPPPEPRAQPVVAKAEVPAQPDPCAPGQKHTAEQCPNLDDDGDGVPNGKDRCPEQAGVPAEQGCPPARAAINAETGKIDIKEKVFFDTGKATIQARSFKLLDDVASLLAANAKVGPIAIEGHTDDRGPADYNRSLSKQRAEAVKAYLVGKGIVPARLDVKGYGPDKPAQPNTTAAGREANRRVEFTILNVKAP